MSSSVKQVVIVTCGCLLVWGVVWTVHIFRTKILPRRDLQAMCVYAFVGDVADFAKQYRRLPNNWTEYGHWRTNRVRSAEWCRERFDIASWGLPITDVTTNMVIVRLTTKRGDSLEQDANQWLIGLLRGLQD